MGAVACAKLTGQQSLPLKLLAMPSCICNIHGRNEGVHRAFAAYVQGAYNTLEKSKPVTEMSCSVSSKTEFLTFSDIPSHASLREVINHKIPGIFARTKLTTMREARPAGCVHFV